MQSSYFPVMVSSDDRDRVGNPLLRHRMNSLVINGLPA